MVTKNNLICFFELIDCIKKGESEIEDIVVPITLIINKKLKDKLDKSISYGIRCKFIRECIAKELKEIEGA